MLDRLADHWTFLIPIALGCASIWMLLPRPGPKSLALGGVVGLAALVMTAFTWIHLSGQPIHNGLFVLFSATAIVAGVCMISQSNPVYAALWFAVVILSTCGLFLLLSAPFLAAATVSVYAGAIIVTFLFVIMLAQQSGLALYDRRSAEPFLSCLAAFILLGAMLFALRPPEMENKPLNSGFVGAQFLEGESKVTGLGRALFTEYLWAVEIGGTLLLTATIGAIAISSRRGEGRP